MGCERTQNDSWFRQDMLRDELCLNGRRLQIGYADNVNVQYNRNNNSRRRKGRTGREDGRLYEKEDDDWKCFRVGTVESGYRVMSPGFFVCIAATAGSTCLLSLCIGCFLMLMVVILLIELNSIHCLRKK